MEATLVTALRSKARSLGGRRRAPSDEPGASGTDTALGAPDYPGAPDAPGAPDHPGAGDASARTSSVEGARARPPLLEPPAWELPARLRGRDDLLRRLNSLVWAPDGRTHVLAGDGGTGKTAVALWVAREAASRGVPVWWVPAADPLTVTVSLLDLAADLGARPAEVAQAGAGQRDVADVVWECLEQRAPWLLVFDGAASTVGTWLRRTHLGLIVVTSRDASRQAWGRHAELHTVGPLDPAAGGRMLTDLAPGAGSAAEAAALSRRLGGSPLALRLAASLIAATGPGNAAQTGPGNAAETADGAAWYGLALAERAGGGGAGSAVVAARDLALEALAAGGRPQARALLRVLCCLAPSVVIPAALLDAGVLGPACGGDAALARKGLRALARVGLIASHDAGVTVHRLVSDGSRVYTGDGARAWAAAAGMLAAAAGGLDPRDPAGWPAWVALAPHVDAAVEAGGVLGEPGLAALCEAAGATALAFLHAGRSAAAAELAARALAHARRLRPDHEAVLALRTAAVRARPEQGPVDGAERDLRDLLAAQVRVLGPEHPDSLGTGHQLATLFARQGQFQQSMWSDLLDAHARILGPGDPATLALRHDFGLALAQRGEYAKAATQFADLLAARARFLGPEHRDTRVTRRWLAHVTAAVTTDRSG